MNGSGNSGQEAERDVTGTQSFNQMLRMAVRRKKVDGGILFVKRYTDAGMVPFQLQIFEVDELDCNQLNTKEKGNRIVGGIEYNQYNRRSVIGSGSMHWTASP